MPDTGKLNWGNIEIEFDTAVFSEAKVTAAIQAIEARLPGFAGRVPAGTLIVLSRHGFSGDYVGAYQVGGAPPRELSRRAWTTGRAARKLLEDIASSISVDISPLRPRHAADR